MNVVIIAIVVLLLISGFLSGTETAMTGASRSRLHRWAKQGKKRAQLVEKLRQDRERVISTLLLANNVVNTLASALAASLFITLYGEETGVFLATVVMSALIVVFAETLPKTYALRNPNQLALFVAPVLNTMVILLSPFARLAYVMVLVMLYPFTPKSTTQQTEKDEEELLGAIDLHAQSQETIDESDMLKNILDLDDVPVEDIMVHRQDVFTLDENLDIRTLIDKAVQCPHMRIPITKGRSDNIIGILHVKNILKNDYRARKDKAQLLKDLSPPWFIPESTSLLHQLRAFQVKKEHMAMVVDEYGTLRGIVTLEDVLEEIVGDIRDEFDHPSPGISKRKDGSIVVEGHIAIRDINRALSWQLPDEHAATIAGLIMNETRTVPKRHQRFRFYGFEFTVLVATPKKVIKLHMKPLETPANDKESD
ncbi:MAG: DUF21 domain-containing protein [Alphaproteobacteria bacterium GM202ARS2]|nr:DUF21 domain-containing protein [Alphaproteobacteria bacterium GM202ARS2]